MKGGSCLLTTIFFMNNIEILRKNINEIDKKIIKLIEERKNLVTEIGELKHQTNERIYIPEREASIISSLSYTSELSIDEIKSIYTEIISTCRMKEKIFNVATIETTNTLLAIKKIFGEHINITKFDALNEVFLNLSDFEFILTPLRPRMEPLFSTDEWFIVNYIKIENEEFYLLSRKQNKLTFEDDVLFFISNQKIDSTSKKIGKNLYLSNIHNNDFKKDNYLTNYILIGIVPAIFYR